VKIECTFDAQEQKTSLMEKALTDFLVSLGIPISKKYVQKLVSSHPDFPSLLSISDILNRFGVVHAARRIAQEDINELSFPFLLPLDKGKGDILLIKNKQDLARHKNDLDQWGGVVLQAEASKQIIDKTNHDLYLKERRSRHYTVALLVLLVILLSLPFIYSFSWLVFALLVTSLAGSVVGYFIFAKEVGVTYTVVDAFCNPGKATVNSCDTLLKADISLLGIKFSDAVPTYFIFQALALGLVQALPEATTGFITVLAWLSVVTLPIIFFSLYYQYFIAKAWCRLCLVVVGILAIQFSLFAISYFNGSTLLLGTVSFISVIVLASLFAVIGLAVLLVKSIIEHTNKLSAVGANGNRVKHSVLVFTQLLVQQKKIDNLHFENEMRVGSPDAPLQIIMVSNLYCNPCKEKHAIVDQLLALYSNQVSVTFRFVKSGKDPESVGHLLGYWQQSILAQENETEKVMALMHDWFELWDLQKFMKKYPVRNKVDELMQLEAAQYAWIEGAGVSHTPTFFINGHELPKEYVIDDLLAIAPGLADSIGAKKSEKSEMTLQVV
jgi:protein-disulfide isomerase